MHDTTGVRILEAREVVRKRPNMFVGSTDERGLNALIVGLIEFSICKVLGNCTFIQVTLNKDNSFTLVNDHLPISIKTSKEDEKPLLEKIMTQARVSGFSSEATFVANALSQCSRVEVNYDTSIYKQEYEEGYPKSEIILVEKPDFPEEIEIAGSIFYPKNLFWFKTDPNVFGLATYNLTTLREVADKITGTQKELAIQLIDLRVV
ncbi:MAG TPA: hypothetical protein VH186_19815 [Chloroflexia bacterium]|nr:hypothetical protein [Chloroflexia bacterium]